MNKTPGTSVYRLTLAGCALSAAACGPSEEIASIGLYSQKDVPVEAGSASGAAVATSGSESASADAGSSSAQAAERNDAGGPFSPAVGAAPACARTSCVRAEPGAHVDPQAHCHQLVGLDGFGGRASPPPPPDFGSDHYVGFPLPAPVQGKEYLRSISPIVGDAKYLHHMKLYETMPATQGSAQQNPARRLLYAWAPGEPSMFLDPAVGVAVSDDTQLEVELHYAGSPDFVVDGSGFELCFTPTAPEHLVSISTLSAAGPAVGPATGTCAPEQARPIFLLAARPHSDSRGTHVKLSVQRQGNGEEILLDAPYDHEFPPLQALGTQLRRGDTLTTRCDFTAPVIPLDGSACEVQVLHWPAHTLVSGPQTAFESCSQ